VLTATIKLDATTLKRFFLARYGLKVRVQTSQGRAGYVRVYLLPEPRTGKSIAEPMRYAGLFPEELGRACAQAVYPDQGWCWCGNLSAHQLAMTAEHWRAALAAVAGDQLAVLTD
jgi:hypothetical protein